MALYVHASGERVRATPGSTAGRQMDASPRWKRVKETATTAVAAGGATGGGDTPTTGARSSGQRQRGRRADTGSAATTDGADTPAAAE